jgi:hypothetical protein
LATRKEKLLAGFHAGAAALGLVLLPFAGLPTTKLAALLFVPYLLFLGASGWTGYRIWEADPRARTWSIVLLGLQIPTAPSEERMHQPGCGRAVVSGWNGQPAPGRFPETRRALQVMRGR